MLVRYSEFSKDLKLNENIAGAKKVLKDTYILNKALIDLDLGYKTDASGMFIMDKVDAPVDFKDLPEDTKAEAKKKVREIKVSEEEQRKIDIPIMVSGTITDASGRTLSGQTVEAFLISISHIPLLSVGFNCALGADQLKPYLQRLSSKTAYFTSAHPNAGLPNAFGEYEQTPEEMQLLIKEYLKDDLVNIIGGCCGTTPDHIRLLAEVAKEYKPRKIKVNA
jgi:hypothetical protein